MEFVLVKALTRKGTNRIREHGRIWKVIQEDSGRRILLESVKDKYLKWIDSVATINDFEILSRHATEESANVAAAEILIN